MKRVVVHVDRLVLTGVGREARDAVAAGLQAELVRLMRDPRVLDRLAASDGVPRLRIRPVRIPSSTGPKSTGAVTARAIAGAGSK